MSQARMSLGKKGEEIAAKYLEDKGFKILARNYRAHQWGELDIVAIEQDTLVFVEVKTRRSYSFGSPADAVTERKLKKLSRACHYFKLCYPQTPASMRIDVIGILMDELGEEVVDLKYFRNVYEET